MESQKNMFQTTNQPWIFHYQRLNHHSITINIPIKSLGILLVVCPTKYLQFSEWISPSAWWLIDPSSPKISPQDWDPSPAIAWTVAWKKWPNSKVYGRYNELVFMGGMSWFINQIHITGWPHPALHLHFQIDDFLIRTGAPRHVAHAHDPPEGGIPTLMPLLWAKCGELGELGCWDVGGRGYGVVLGIIEPVKTKCNAHIGMNNELYMIIGEWVILPDLNRTSGSTNLQVLTELLKRQECPTSIVYI